MTASEDYTERGPFGPGEKAQAEPRRRLGKTTSRKNANKRMARLWANRTREE